MVKGLCKINHAGSHGRMLNTKAELRRRVHGATNYILARSLHIGRNLCEVVQLSFQLYLIAKEQRRIQDSL